MPVITAKRLHDAVYAENRMGRQLPKHVYTELCFKKLHPMLGMMEWEFVPSSETYIVSDKLLRRVDMLLGPHAYAMFRAWAINQLEASNE
jgi:hypothetical protein